ncbi:transcription antiterminator [Staphylococcus taiwanensis]|nr:transcription antiterminator [Staphylococcus taiwanensis]
MSEYYISKTLNNNVIICTYNNQEVILIGKGIGFNKKAGMTLDDDASIEKVYKLEHKQQQEYYKSLVEIADEDVLQAVIEAVNYITSTICTIDDKNLVVALTDHIIFAYKRLKQNQVISNPFAIETQHLYSEAYTIASQVIDRLNQRLDVEFPPDEIGFIALHIASNTDDLTIHEMSLINKLIGKSILIIENDLDHKVDNQTVQYQRFIRHIQFLIRRLNKQEYVYAQDVFIDMVKTHYPNSYNTAFKISRMMQKHLNVPVDDSEIVYLALHIYHFETQMSSS